MMVMVPTETLDLLEAQAFERGRAAGKKEAELETEHGSFSGHVQAVFLEARKLRDALAGDKLVDGLGAALNAHDDFLRR
jgi:hypothetical protein